MLISNKEIAYALVGILAGILLIALGYQTNDSSEVSTGTAIVLASAGFGIILPAARNLSYL